MMAACRLRPGVHGGWRGQPVGKMAAAAGTGKDRNGGHADTTARVHYDAIHGVYVLLRLQSADERLLKIEELG